MTVSKLGSVVDQNAGELVWGLQNVGSRMKRDETSVSNCTVRQCLVPDGRNPLSYRCEKPKIRQLE